MMDKIEQEREAWKKKAQMVGKQVVAPRADEIDAKGEFPWDIAEVFAKEGFLSLLIPKNREGWISPPFDELESIALLLSFVSSRRNNAIALGNGRMKHLNYHCEGKRLFCLTGKKEL
jgi:alkylation response protein AidB-like acyl-CoA dehydrogenase